MTGILDRIGSALGMGIGRLWMVLGLWMAFGLLMGCDEDSVNDNSSACDELEFVPLDDGDVDVSDAQQDAMEAFFAIDGEWTGTLECSGKDLEEIGFSVSGIENGNIELVLSGEEGECATIGRVSFQVEIQDSSDPDLAGGVFEMTGELLEPLQVSEYPENNILLDANSGESEESVVEGVAIFRFELRVDETNRPVGYKVISTEPESDGQGGITFTQGVACSVFDWVPAAS